MSKIFLGYCPFDRSIAIQVYRLLLDSLELEEPDIFLTSISGGSPSDAEPEDIIEEQIHGCTSMVLLVSWRFLKSRYCLDAYDRGKKLNKYIHLLLLDDAGRHDLWHSPLRSACCRPLNDKDNLFNLLCQLRRELSLTPLVEERFEPSVILYMRLGYSEDDGLVPGKAPVPVYHNEEADDYIDKLESNCDNSIEAKYLLGCALFDGMLVRADEDRAVRLIRECADEGHVPSLLKLAYFHCRGVVRYGSLQFDEAFKCVKRASEIAPYEPRVCIAMGLMYYYGVGCRRDLDTSREFFHTWRCRGNKRSTDYLESLESSRKCPRSLLSFIEDYVPGYDPGKLYEAGMVYLYGGTDFEPDLEKSYDYLLRAASKGVIESEGILGQFCYFGWGSVKRDFDEAAKHFQRSAQSGDKVSQRFLGILCQSGILRGGWHKALEWYQLAAWKGDAEASFALGVMLGQYGRGSSYQESLYYLMTAASYFCDAECMVGDAHRFGLLGCEKSSFLASFWYMDARNKGSHVAELRQESAFGF